MDDSEAHHKSLFPETWQCLFCDPPQQIERDGILSHMELVHGQNHSDDDHDLPEQTNLTWKGFYNRMVQVGGL